MSEFTGVYRAQFLSSDNLGNVKCTVPSVTGHAPVKALSTALDPTLLPKPGEMGWVVFEGGDPSLPVWVGGARPATTFHRTTATVTAVSPFTILLNGVSVVSPEHSPNYGPVVGETVLVLTDGVDPYVLEAVNRGGLVYARRFDYGPTQIAATGTSADLTISTPIAPATGTVEVSISYWGGFSAGSPINITTMIYTNTYAGPNGAAWQTPQSAAAQGGAGGAWFPLHERLLIYPVVAGAGFTPVVRFTWASSTNFYVSGFTMVKVYAA